MRLRTRHDAGDGGELRGIGYVSMEPMKRERDLLGRRASRERAKGVKSQGEKCRKPRDLQNRQLLIRKGLNILCSSTMTSSPT